MSVKKVNESLFLAIEFCFSAVLLVITLLLSIRLTAEGDRLAELEAAVKNARTENEILTAQYENTVSLEDIEKYAIEILGMQRCDPSQIIYVSEQPD